MVEPEKQGGWFKRIWRDVDTDPEVKIKGHINSFNYDYPFPNAERLEKEEKNVNLLRYFHVQWSLVFLIGFGVGATVLAITFVIEELILLKVKMYSSLFTNMGDNATIAINFAFTIVFSVLSCVPIVFWKPVARGSGAPETQGFLNGLDIPGMELWSYTPARLLSSISYVFAGLPGGQTEGIIPVGLSLASNLCKLKIRGARVFASHRYDSERREFGAVGLGACAAASFGTPVGGVFYVLQQLSTWRAGAITMMAVGSLVASYLFIVVYNFVRVIDRTIEMLKDGIEKRQVNSVK